MGKIYKKAHDMNVVGAVIYSRNNKAYKDVTCDIPYTTSELKEAFIKGAVVDIASEEYDNAERLVLNPSSFGVSNVNGYGYVNCSIPRVRKNHYHIYPCQGRSIQGYGAYGSVSRADPQYIDQGSTYVEVNGDGSNEVRKFGLRFGGELSTAINELRNGPMTISMDVSFNGTKTDDATFSIKVNDYSGKVYENTFPIARAYNHQTIYLTIDKPLNSYPDVEVCLNNMPASSSSWLYVYSIQVEYGLNVTEFEPPRDSDWVDVVKSKASADT